MSYSMVNRGFPTYAMSENSALYVNKPTFHTTRIEQFVSAAIQASDQYASTAGITYAALNLMGHPRHFPDMGDYSDTYMVSQYGNWWQEMPSAVEEFGLKNVPKNLQPCDAYVLCLFNELVYPLQMIVYETLCPGTVQKVWMRTGEDSATFPNVWVLLWDRALDSGANTVATNPFTIQLRNIYEPSRMLRLELNFRHLDYHAAIDGIMLKGGDKNIPPVYFPAYSWLSHKIATIHEEHINPPPPSAEIAQLPEELLLTVFQHLDIISLARVAQVCRKFQRVSQDARLYFDLNLRPYWMMASPLLYEWASIRATRCKRLDLSWNSDQGFPMTLALNKLLTTCLGTLTHLRMCFNSSVTDSMLQMVWQDCPQLRELSIAGWGVAQTFPSGNIKRTNLVRLDMANNGWLETPMLLSIVANSPQLEHLNINFCSNLLLPELFELLGRNNHQLISLNAVKAGQLRSEALCCLAGCTKLQEIDIGWTFQEFDWNTEHLAYLLTACPGIRKLFLSATRALQDNDLFEIAERCTQLEQLSLVGCSNVTPGGIVYVLENCKNLKLLDISHCNGVENEALLMWQEVFPTAIKRVEQFGDVNM